MYTKLGFEGIKRFLQDSYEKGTATEPVYLRIKRRYQGGYNMTTIENNIGNTINVCLVDAGKVNGFDLYEDHIGYALVDEDTYLRFNKDRKFHMCSGKDFTFKDLYYVYTSSLVNMDCYESFEDWLNEQFVESRNSRFAIDCEINPLLG